MLMLPLSPFITPCRHYADAYVIITAADYFHDIAFSWLSPRAIFAFRRTTLSIISFMLFRFRFRFHMSLILSFSIRYYDITLPFRCHY